MSRRANVYVVAGILGAGAFVVPSLGLASSGGAGLNSNSNSNSSSSQARSGSSNDKMGVVQPGDGKVSADGGGISLSTHMSGFLNRNLKLVGHVWTSAHAKVVEIERRGRETGGQWAPTAHATVSHGAFTVMWDANHIGRFAIRAVLENAPDGRAYATSPSVKVTIFKLAIATTYGPGFYGSTTACGERLEQSTLGTANRTLPCGTHVEVYYRGRTIIVPVIDRGPYANGADWDLTEATARKLGDPGTETVGAVSLPGSH